MDITVIKEVTVITIDSSDDEVTSHPDHKHSVKSDNLDKDGYATTNAATDSCKIKTIPSIVPASTPIVDHEKTKSILREFADAMMQRNNKFITERQHKNFKRQLYKLFLATSELSASNRSRLHNYIEIAKDVLLKTNDATVWKIIRLVRVTLRLYSDNNTCPDAENDSSWKRLKEDIIGNYESEMEILERYIKDTESLTCGQRDDESSAYVKLEKYKSDLVEAYKKICKLKGIRPKTNRPVQKYFSLPVDSKNSDIAKIRENVENLMNGKSHLFLPDYAQIHSLVREINTKESMNLSASSITTLSMKFFHDITAIVEERRREDFALLFGSNNLESTRDPAEDDELLQKQLENNRKKRKVESDALAHYSLKQIEIELKKK